MTLQTGTRVAIVTGAARGIGQAIALQLARSGMAVALIDQLETELATTRNEIEQAGHTTLSFKANVADFTAAQDIAVEIARKWGRIDVLVNNAGRSQPKGLLEITEQEWDETIDVNLKSHFNWCKAAVPAMMAHGGGRIINISSMNAHTGGAYPATARFAYAAAKAGILGLTRGLARELAPKIAVNAICPGMVSTKLTEANLRGREAELLKEIPLARYGVPDDIAEVVTFLATARSMFITGEVIDVDGGQWIN